MSGIAAPTWYTLKANLKTYLAEVATAEKAISGGRDFFVAIDRARPWIENEQNIALVNILVQSIDAKGTKAVVHDEVTVNLDFYVLGTVAEQTDPQTGAVTLLPADESAAARLDLLIAQARHAICRLKNYYLGFSEGAIDRSHNLTVTYYSQENELATGQFAPARLSFTVRLAYAPEDDGQTVDLEELNVTFKRNLENWSVKYINEPETEEDPEESPGEE